MIKYLPLKEIVKYLRCPYDKNHLKQVSKTLCCSNCSRRFPVNNNIVEFVHDNELNNRTKMELKGNEYKLDKKTIRKYANKDRWSYYDQYQSDKKFATLIEKLNKISAKGIISLGSGTGYELKKILQVKKFDLVFSSDLSFTATTIVPYSLKKFNIDLGLFTADMNYSPFIPHPEIPLIVYEAMHHTSNVHDTMKSIMLEGYDKILFVEPTTNFIVKFLAKLGLAERVEYSGSKPSLLSIKKLRKIAKKYNYDLEIDTVWEFPEDYYRKVLGNNRFLEKLFLKFVDLCSWIGNFNKIGYMSIGFLSKKTSPEAD